MLVRIYHAWMNRPKTVAERIRHLRALGHSQVAIADACGITQPSVGRYLSGARQSAREDTAMRVAEGYRVLSRRKGNCPVRQSRSK